MFFLFPVAFQIFAAEVLQYYDEQFLLSLLYEFFLFKVMISE